MTHPTQPRASIQRRLKRIEGQVQGVQRMLEDDRYCIDILHQIQAAKSALTKVETELLRAHASDCVKAAQARGSMAEKREKIVELVDLFERLRKQKKPRKPIAGEPLPSRQRACRKLPKGVPTSLHSLPRWSTLPADYVLPYPHSNPHIRPED